MKRSNAIFYLALAASLWSLAGILIKLVQWNPLAIAGARSAISALIIWAYIRKPKFTWKSDQILAALFYMATVLLFVCANKFTTAANAILLQYGSPVYVAIFGSLILKEKTKISDWVTIGLVIFGMFLFFLDKLGPSSFAGNIMGVLSGVAFAFLIIFLRKQKDASPIESTLMGNILTALIGLPFMFRSVPNAISWVGIILLGVFQLGLSYILYSTAIKYVTALEAILISVIEPILNPIWVFLFAGEKPSTWAFFGGTIILTSVTLRYALPALKNKSVKSNA
ncbi:DMT family transporter [Thermotoga profunda]|uniref:DMT family transporter n=1 Tax=Thermotoga profunda TaxID=1508420 RepID=UPI000AB457FB|nr:DMT family transporter [Thermotoga profunda]